MSYQFAFILTFSNPYIIYIVNNMDFIMILNREQKN